MPMSGPTQRCLRFVLEVRPATPVFSYEEVGGTVHHFSVLEPHLSLDIVATALVEMLPAELFAGVNLVQTDAEFYRSWETRDTWAEFLGPSPYVALSQSVAAFAPPWPVDLPAARYLLDLTRFLYETLDYDQSATDVHTQVEEVLELEAGVCQDFAHLMLACCRIRGIPARYVSGYLYAGEGLRGELGSHAWVECLLPSGHWLSLDPTNNLIANEHYIRVHVGRDYADVSPTRGVYVGSAATKMDFGVTVVEVPAPARLS